MSFLILLCGQRGIHNIEKEISSKENNKIVAHDSEGFEAGRSKEVDVVKNFFERRSKMSNINERLHLVWFACLLCTRLCPLSHFISFRYCMEMNSRPIQHAEKEIFSSFSEGSTIDDVLFPK
jgi:hypothetical protein